jgi:hypothetical protein
MRKNLLGNFSSPFIKKIARNKNDICTLLILLGIIIFFFVPSFISKDLTGDFITQILPWYHFTYVNIKHGIVPFWSPYAFSGIPHLFKPELAIFYPFSILIIILDLILNTHETIGLTGHIIEMITILNVCVGACGVYVISRKILFLSPIPSLFASLAYSLNPFSILEMHPTFVFFGLNLLPWLIFLLVRFLTEPTFSKFLLVSVANYLLFSLGYPYFFVYFFVAEFCMAIFYGFKKIYLLLVCTLVSLLLSSFFLLSYIDIYLNSARSSNNLDLAFHTFASLNPVKILEVINPISFNTTNPANLPSFLGGTTFSWGSFAFLFLIYGLFSLRRKPIYFWIIGVFFISLFYSFGGYLQSHTFFGALIPIIYKFRSHMHALIFTVFTGALLIGLGIQTIQNRIRIRYIELFFWAFLLILFSGLMLGQVFFSERIVANIEIFTGTMISLIFLFVSLIITALTIKFGSRSFLIVGLIIMLLEYNLFFHNFQYFFTNKVTYDQFYKINSLIPEVPNKDNLFRMYFEDNQFAYNTSVFGIYNANGYENTPSPTTGERYERYGVIRYYQITNTKYVVTTTDNWQSTNPNVVKIKTIVPASLPLETYFHSPDKNHFIYQIKNYLPRFYIPGEVVECDNPDCLLKENPPKLVVANGLPEKIKNPKKGVSLKVGEFSPNTVKLNITTPHKTFIASSEIWDKGWSIKINNQSSTIYNTSNGLRGFIVPPGKSEVVMNYFPPRLLPGALLTFIGIILLVIIWKINFIERSDTMIKMLYNKLWIKTGHRK